jgi:eukaryotic-like serine/threonine-protein kinase
MEHPGLVGQTLLHYRVTEKIGEGGMGAVYKAVDTHLDRPVAVKVLPPDKVADPERKARFVQEAKAASALRHPNIVVIHDIASDRGLDFIVMELVEGQPLDQLVGRRGLKLGEALAYAVQIADGLAKAHGAGIVHRDLKPTNVMVTADGLVKILDFGLAKLTETSPSSEAGPTMTIGREEKPRTEEGYILGTAAYMSPEQAEGRKVDARSDIFSFGTVLYEMLTGRRAFGRDSRIKTLAAVLNEEPKPASAVIETVPGELERIIGRCLRKDPQRRWQTMSDLKVALQDLKEDSESGKLQAPAAARKGPGRLVGIAAGVVIIATAVLLVKLVLLKPKGPVEYDIIPMTFDSGMTSFPTLAPKGDLMAYVSDREGNGNLDIWVQQVSGGEPLRLTDHPADDWFPSFSPDGSKIAFRSERDGGGIYVIDALAVGGQPRRVADQGFAPKFSPDGQWIAYLVLPGSLEARHFKVYIVSPKGGEPRPILADFRFNFIVHGASLVWSPDSRSLLFSGRPLGDPKGTDWWVAPIDGSEPVRTHALDNLGLRAIVQFPAGWAGTSVYYVAGTTIEGVNLFVARIDRKTRQITGPASAVTNGPGMKLFPSVMSDGRIFFTEMNVAMNAWSVPARTDEAAVSAKPYRLTQDRMQDFGPTVSRDGSRATFSAFGGVQAARMEVRILDLRSGEEAKFPMRAISIDQNARLSPDGTLLAYRDIVDGKETTFLASLNGAAPRPLCEGGFVTGFFPANDAVLVRFKPDELVRMNILSGEKQIVLSSRGDVIGDACLSPDGRSIAWQAGEPDGRTAIRITPVEGPADGKRQAVTATEADRFLASPGWSPNGRWLYYLSEKTGRCSILAREFDPRTGVFRGDERVVLETIESRLWLNYPKGNGQISVAADKIVFEGTGMTGNIYLARPKAR